MSSSNICKQVLYISILEVKAFRARGHSGDKLSTVSYQGERNWTLISGIKKSQCQRLYQLSLSQKTVLFLSRENLLQAYDIFTKWNNMLEVLQRRQSSLKSVEFFLEILQEWSKIYHYIKSLTLPVQQYQSLTKSKKFYIHVYCILINWLSEFKIYWWHLFNGLKVDWLWILECFPECQRFSNNYRGAQQISWLGDLKIYGNFEKHAQCAKWEARLWLPDAHTQAAIHLTNSPKEGCIASVKETSLILKSKQWSRGFLHFQSLASCNVIQCKL